MNAPSRRSTLRTVHVAMVALSGVLHESAFGQDRDSPLLGFDERCSLADGSLVKLVRPPHPPSRAAFLRQVPEELLGPPGRVPRDLEKAAFVFAWRDGKLTVVRAGGGTLATVLMHALDVEHTQVRGDGGLMNTLVPGDIVIDGDAGFEDLVAAFEHLARHELKAPARLSVRTEDLDVLVATGAVEIETFVGKELRFELYPPGQLPEHSSSFTHRGTWGRMLRDLGNYAGCPVADDTRAGGEILSYAIVRPELAPIDPAEFADPGKLEAHRARFNLLMGSTRTHTPPAVMRQTGVPLRVEKRPVKLVYFERGALGE